MIYAFVTGKKEQDTYIKSFSVSCGAKIVHTRHFVSLQHGHSSYSPRVVKKKFLPGVTGIAFSGILRGNFHLFEMAKNQNLDVYYIDHAYFGRGYKNPCWMRITKNGFIQNLILSDINEKRYETHFDTNFKDYNFTNKNNIVLLPPSNVMTKVFNQSEWEKNTIEKIRKYTDRPIVVRRKDGPSIDDLLINPTKAKSRNVYEKSLEEELRDAYCVVAFNSTAALDALKMGVPVICEKYCPAFPLSHAFDQIENLQEKDRLKLFKSLACGQYTFDEVSQTKTFNYLNSIKQWKGDIL
jgi:hypothetical protein